VSPKFRAKRERGRLGGATTGGASKRELWAKMGGVSSEKGGRRQVHLDLWEGKGK